MSLDIIEIALDRISDFVGFERLATDVMYLEGWVNIKPLGGVADLGQDATSERFYESGESERTVFQYTLQEYLPGKVNDTIEKLNQNGVKFAEIVVVTPHQISSEAQTRMIQDARKTHQARLTIYERKTIASRLSDLQNGLFNRHFPNVHAQIADLTRVASQNSFPGGSLERILLQVSLTLTFRPDAQRARKALFDYFLLAVVLAEPQQTVATKDLEKKLGSSLQTHKQIPDAQISAAIGRLSKSGLLSTIAENVTATEKAISDVTASTVRLSEATNSFAADLLAAVQQGVGRRLSNDERKRVTRNARAALLELARTNSTSWDSPAAHPDQDVVTAAKNQLTEDVANAMIAALAECLRVPTPEQAETLKKWTQAYTAFAIMGLDPTLNSFQAAKFNKKIFIIDTDIVLDTVIADLPRSSGVRTLLRKLAALGCRLVIPDSVLEECIRHAQGSVNTYKYFGETLLQLTPALVEERVWNAFVAGYYYGTRSGRLRGTYDAYLRNYLEVKDSKRFFTDVIKETAPFIELSALADIGEVTLSSEEVERYTERFKIELSKSKKAKYRTPEEANTLARTDAVLFLTALRLNPSDESREGDVLGGACYLLTEAVRYARAAKALGVNTQVTVRPGALAAVQEIIGNFDVSSTEFLQLFENPFLNSAVSAVWPDVEKLVRSGVDLSGKSLPRLRFDLEGGLHSFLTTLSDAEEAAEEGGDAIDPDQKFLQLLDAATSRGYSLIPEVGRLRERIETGEQRAGQLKQELDKFMEQNEMLQEKIAFFGRRKQRYLRRVARTKK